MAMLNETLSCASSITLLPPTMNPQLDPPPSGASRPPRPFHVSPPVLGNEDASARQFFAFCQGKTFHGSWQVLPTELGNPEGMRLLLLALAHQSSDKVSGFSIWMRDSDEGLRPLAGSYLVCMFHLWLYAVAL